MDNANLLYIALLVGLLNLVGTPVTVAWLERRHRRQLRALQDADAAHRTAWDTAQAESRQEVKAAIVDQYKVNGQQAATNDKQAVLNEAMSAEVKRLHRARVRVEHKLDSVEQNQVRILEAVERIEEGQRTRTIIREETAFLRHLSGTQVNVGDVSAARDAHVGSTFTHVPSDKENPS